ncbi:Metal resistance protein YCF1 [Smittium mucronatum]|uniref:Metal resistance protein YCF1 n=1 Tax=Smittium mucronatum TaxID=133383 RepID=A0A1R0GXF9_9FUNG|nr:Metal resistance protein YCF1 [Smittium mucronatum]
MTRISETFLLINTEHNFPDQILHFYFLKILFTQLLLGILLFVLENLHSKQKDLTLIEEFEECGKNPVEGFQNVEDRSNIFSMFTFSWLNPVVDLSFKKDLTVLDLFQPPKNIQTVPVSVNFWKDRKNMPHASLFMSLVRNFGLYYSLAGFLKLLQDLLLFCQPLLFKRLISFISNYNKGLHESIKIGVYYATSMLLLSLIQSVILNQYFNICMLTSIRVRSALVSSIYKKSLSLNNKSLSQFGTGEIVNRMAVDTERISDAIQFCHIIWSGPLQIFISVYLLFDLLGWSSLVGSALLIVAIPINAFYAKKMNISQLNLMKQKDNRINLTDEALLNIRVIKLLAWETPFLERIRLVRNSKELKSLYDLGLLLSIQQLISIAIPILVTLVTFAIYSKYESHSRGPLNSSVMFASISLFTLLRFPLLVFPRAIYLVVGFTAGISRISKYLNSEEISHDSIQNAEISQNINPICERPNEGLGGVEFANNDIALNVNDASFSWGLPSSVPTLSNIDLSIRNNELFAVIGGVGSGKTSFLMSLLGETYKLKGYVTIKGKISYTPQKPWLLNSSILENITFGNKYDPEFLDEVLFSCGLKHDIKNLPNGISTVVGENGAKLSGGQRARVSIARALYSRSQIYLFDDPFAAIDSHITSHLFKHVFGRNGILKNKTRIITTSSIPFFKFFDSVAILNNGVIVEQGLVKDLEKIPGFLSRLVNSGNNDTVSISSASASASSSPFLAAKRSNGSVSKVLNESYDNIIIDKSNTPSIIDPSISALSLGKSISITHPETQTHLDINSNDLLVSDAELVDSEATKTGVVDLKFKLNYLMTCGILPISLFLISSVISQMYSKFETDSVALERIDEYSHIKPEELSDQKTKDSDELINVEWPEGGQVEFKDYSCTYSEDLPPALKNINFNIKSKNKVGIVGRTGAGKSSFSLSIFRAIESLSGAIIIDGIDINNVGLHDLRSRISIVPQDPSLFSGSIRFNLYPFNDLNNVDGVSDEELWTALELAQLKSHVIAMDGGLDAILNSNSNSLSIGQQQQLCIARALIRKSKIVVMDEATSSIDYETDEKLQLIIKDAFSDKTVITIAHKINTIVDCDQILVLEDGMLVESGNPRDLLDDKDSRFFSLFDGQFNVLND